MLVANARHTPHTYVSKSSSYKSISNGNTIVPSSSNGTNESKNVKTLATSLFMPLLDTSTCSLIKSMSVRLNRGSEYIRQTMNNVIRSRIPYFISSNGNTLTVPPTKTHREPRLDTNSTDSIISEICCFQPIRSMPTTTSRRSTSNQIRIPIAKRLNVSTHKRPCSINFLKSRLILSQLSDSQNSAFHYVKNGTTKNSIIESRNGDNKNEQLSVINLKRWKWKMNLFRKEPSRSQSNNKETFNIERSTKPRTRSSDKNRINGIIDVNQNGKTNNKKSQTNNIALNKCNTKIKRLQSSRLKNKKADDAIKKRQSELLELNFSQMNSRITRSQSAKFSKILNCIDTHEVKTNNGILFEKINSNNHKSTMKNNDFIKPISKNRVLKSNDKVEAKLKESLKNGTQTQLRRSKRNLRIK